MKIELNLKNFKAKFKKEDSSFKLISEFDYNWMFINWHTCKKD